MLARVSFMEATIFESVFFCAVFVLQKRVSVMRFMVLKLGKQDGGWDLYRKKAA